jgi:hypothetical protein
MPPGARDQGEKVFEQNRVYLALARWRGAKPG